ncbi:MAG: hypothetical protein JNL28_17515 [Planctomycetes bacterium]|nr:hypothetical protein [Planctomycetota bacterium]
MKALTPVLCTIPLLFACTSSTATKASSDAPTNVAEWQDTFQVDKSDLASTGTNPYFILVPGYRCDYANEEGNGALRITVLDATEMIDGVETRVVEEREMENGQLVEISRNFFAISKTTQDVYYFGEDVDIYKDGKIKSHDGAWRSGVDGAKFGLMMPGQATVGRRYYQEVAPKVALDRVEIRSVTTTYETPAGEFTGCLKVEETTPLEPKARDYKIYAPGIGLIMDGELKLVAHGKLK